MGKAACRWEAIQAPRHNQRMHFPWSRVGPTCTLLRPALLSAVHDAPLMAPSSCLFFWAMSGMSRTITYRLKAAKWLAERAGLVGREGGS